MADLHASLAALGPRELADVPMNSLAEFLQATFEAAETIINSVPPPPASKDEVHSSISALAATCAAEIKLSKHRLHSVHPEHESLQSKWGKPIKLSTSSNPTGLTMYKMAANDRNGAWFGRRSVHEGIPFDKWKKAMQSEFAESLAVTGGPGAGSIRGIGADRLLERKIVPGLGRLEVYQLSAQFPAPTAPRDFVTLLLTTDSGLSQKSANHIDNAKVGKQIPRHYMVVSIPLEHPGAPPRQGLVRGKYESVEMIREVITPSGLSKDARSAIGIEPTDGNNQEKSTNDDKNAVTTYPVEWSMITRSDPGGGIPRFMVERGTPGSIATDAGKFLDWAAGQEEFKLPDVEVKSDLDSDSDSKGDKLELPTVTRQLSDNATFEPSRPTDTGVIAALTSVVKDSIGRYVPDSVQNGISSMLPGESAEHLTDNSDDSSDVSSLNSWASAEQFTTAPELQPRLLKSDQGATSSTTSIVSETSSDKVSDFRQRLDKELLKLEAKRKHLDKKFAKAQEKEEAKAQEQISKDKKDEAKIRERLEKDKAKHEERYNKEVKKLDDKRKHEEARAEDRKKKIIDDDALARVTRQRDQARRMAEVLRKENEIWKERVGDLQKENTMLVARLSRVQGGHGIIKEVQHELVQGNSKSKKANNAKSSKDEGSLASS